VLRYCSCLLALAVILTGTCAWAQTGFWGHPVNLGAPVNTTANELSGVLADSGRTLYFARTGAGHNDLYVSRREGDTWSRPLPLSALNTPAYNELNPTLSIDRQRLYFISDRVGGTGGFDIYSATWDGRTWSDPQRLGPEVNTDNDEWYAAEAAEGLYLSARTQSGTNRGDILIAAGTFPTFTPRVPVPTLATSAREMSAYPVADGSLLYVSTDREGGMGLDDVWHAYRGDSAWGEPHPTLCDVNTPDFDQYPTVTVDGMHLLFASYHRADGLGGSDLYTSSWHALGDMNGNRRATTGDIIYLVNHLFEGGPEPADPRVADPNCDGKISIVDVVVLVNYILRAGPAPCIECAG